ALIDISTMHQQQRTYLLCRSSRHYRILSYRSPAQNRYWMRLLKTLPEGSTQSCYIEESRTKNFPAQKNQARRHVADPRYLMGCGVKNPRTCDIHQNAQSHDCPTG